MLTRALLSSSSSSFFSSQVFLSPFNQRKTLRFYLREVHGLSAEEAQAAYLQLGVSLEDQYNISLQNLLRKLKGNYFEAGRTKLRELKATYGERLDNVKAARQVKEAQQAESDKLDKAQEELNAARSSADGMRKVLYKYLVVDKDAKRIINAVDKVSQMVPKTDGQLEQLQFRGRMGADLEVEYEKRVREAAQPLTAVLGRLCCTTGISQEEGMVKDIRLKMAPAGSGSPVDTKLDKDDLRDVYKAAHGEAPVLWAKWEKAMVDLGAARREAKARGPSTSSAPDTSMDSSLAAAQELADDAWRKVCAMYKGHDGHVANGDKSADEAWLAWFEECMSRFEEGKVAEELFKARNPDEELPKSKPVRKRLPSSPPSQHPRRLHHSALIAAILCR